MNTPVMCQSIHEGHFEQCRAAIVGLMRLNCQYQMLPAGCFVHTGKTAKRWLSCTVQAGRTDVSSEISSRIQDHGEDDKKPRFVRKSRIRSAASSGLS